jgi:hypothetical protein
LDFTSCISASYDEYAIEIVGIIPASANNTLLMQFSTDGGSSYDTSSVYNWGRIYQGVSCNDTGYSSAQNTNGIYWAADSLDNASAGGLSGSGRMFNPLSSTTYKVVNYETQSPTPSPQYFRINFGGQYHNLSAVNAFRFILGSGNIASGTVRCYGVVGSGGPTAGAPWNVVTAVGSPGSNSNVPTEEAVRTAISAVPVGGSAVVQYASILTGQHASCNLLTGLTSTGGTCVDDTVALNAFLATATASQPVKLMQDIGSLTSGIVIPAGGNVTIECTNWSAGYFIKAGSNSHAVRNIAAADGYSWNATPGTPGQNVTISGCMVNPNRGNGTTGNSTSGDPRSPAGNPGCIGCMTGIMLDNLVHVRVLHTLVYDAPTMGILCNSCSDAVFDGDEVWVVAHEINQDGIHIDGPSSNIRISNYLANTSDDAIAINAAEGYGGTVDGVAVTNVQCVGCLVMYRQLSNETGGAVTNAAVKNVVITNVAGTLSRTSNVAVTPAALRLGEGHSNTSTIDIQQSVKVSNLHFSDVGDTLSANLVDIKDNIGTLELSDWTWDSPQDSAPAIKFSVASTVSSLSINNGKIYQTAAGPYNAFLAYVSLTSTVKNFHVNGFSIDQAAGHDAPGQSSPIIAVGNDGSAITNLDIQSLTPAGQTSLASFAYITNVYGSGLAATGFQIPDANVPDTVPYISGTGVNAGHFCVKSSLGVPSCL